MLLLIFIFGVLCSSGLGQDIRRCSKIVSEDSPEDIEVHCSCMEQLIETDCPKNILKLDWNTLQTYVGVKKLVFDHANVIFESTTEKMTNCSVIELIFYNSYFINISANAFKGLKIIDTIRIVRSEIESIDAKAFSELHHLKTIEIANSTINIVKSDAFFDLPRIEELAFVSTNISILETNAIHIMNSTNPSKTECATLIRSRTSAAHFMNDVVGRSLSHIGSVTLPTHGSKLIFFNSKIGLLNSKSISTNNFAYIIFGRNIVDELESKAINSVIKNDCDIAAILFVGNFFREVKPQAFIDITGSETHPFNTVLSMVDNIFNNVGPMGFLLDPKIKTSFIRDNHFTCSHCNQFMWLLSNEKYEPQIRLERELVETSRCIDKKDLVTFLKGCPDDGYTLITEIPGESTQDFTGIPSEAESMTTQEISSSYTNSPITPTDGYLKSHPSKSNVIRLSLILILFQAILNCVLFLEGIQKKFFKLLYKTTLT
ncbi:hypothetical protein Avbf_02371 [Armadillidium vulgare]|nr:hypothetical protein Avbf_02371 [Armadillidium vulgare]